MSLYLTDRNAVLCLLLSEIPPSKLEKIPTTTWRTFLGPLIQLVSAPAPITELKFRQLVMVALKACQTISLTKHCTLQDYWAMAAGSGSSDGVAWVDLLALLEKHSLLGDVLCKDAVQSGVRQYL